MKCAFVKENRDQCQAHPMKDSAFCYTHNPDISVEDKKDAQVRGGKGNAIKLSSSLPVLQLTRAQDVVTLLEDTINRVRSGELDIRIGNTIGYLCGHLIKAIEVAEIEQRVLKVEKVILERRTI